jgi:hypothetical protein
MLNTRSLASFALLSAVLCSATGCHVVQGPNIGLLMYPVPVSPFFQKRLEDKAWEHERYDRVPILGPMTSGGPPVALDPPSPDEVMRALERARPVQGGFPFLHEIRRDNIRMVTEPIADYVDDVRVMPLVGPVQQHHAHYKCTVYFTETQTIGWPIPHTVVDEDASEVVYIDHNHLHQVGAVDDTETSPY